MKLNLNNPTTKVVWLDRKLYPAYAQSLVAQATDNKGDTDVSSIMAVLNGHATGATTSKGCSVYLAELLAQFDKISPELGAALRPSKSGSTASVEDF